MHDKLADIVAKVRTGIDAIADASAEIAQDNLGLCARATALASTTSVVAVGRVVGVLFAVDLFST